VSELSKDSPILTLRLEQSSTQVCAMRLSLVVKMALSERCPDRSSHPITLVKRPAVEKPWTERPGQVSRKLTTSAVAIAMFEQIDGTPAGPCQTHVVLRCLAVVGQWLRVEKGNCM
jgi:hypothetical protein